MYEQMNEKINALGSANKKMEFVSETQSREIKGKINVIAFIK
jgi:hypothetical protein